MVNLSSTIVSSLGETSLDQLVEHYMNLPALGQRVDISSLVHDKIISGESTIASWKKPFYNISDSTLKSTIVTSILTIPIMGYLNQLPTEPGSSEYINIPIIFFAEGLAIGLINDYLRKRRNLISPAEIRPQSLIEKAKYLALNNPKISSTLFGGSLPYFYLYLHRVSQMLEPSPQLFSLPELIFMGMMGYGICYTLLEFAKSNEFVKRGFEEYQKRHLNLPSQQNKLRLAYDQLFEHPGLVAGAASLITFLNFAVNIYLPSLANSINQGFLIPFVSTTLPVIAMNAYLSLLAGIIAYLGASTLSWALHSNSLSLLKDTLMARINSSLGKNEGAIKNLKHLMEIPTTSKTEQQNHFRLGDLYLKTGRIDDALREYYLGIELVGPSHRTYLNPLDLVFSLFESINIMSETNLSYLKGFVQEIVDTDLFKVEIQGGEKILPSEFDKKFYRFYSRLADMDTTKRLKLFATQVRIKEFIDADKCIRRILASDPSNPETHILYAKFLDRMGDIALAESEYRTAIRFILSKDPSTSFERIGISRNEVMTYNASQFLNKTLVFKRSKTSTPLEEEYNNLSFFYKLFQDKVAKPLALLEHDSYTYMVMEHSGEKTLADLQEESRLTPKLIEDSLKQLFHIQRGWETYGQYTTNPRCN